MTRRDDNRTRRMLLGGAAIAATLLGAIRTASATETIDQVRADVAAASAPATVWDGPTTGPKAAKDKLVVYVADTQTNAGSAGTAAGAREAATALGWRFQLIDGQNTASGEAAAFEQALALHPDGIISGSLDVTQFKSLFKRAADQGIKIVTWHGAATPGPVAAVPQIFWNVSTDPYQIANTAAKVAVAQSNGTAQAVVLTDPQFAIVVTKTKGETDALEGTPGAAVLSVENAYTQISQRMPSLMSTLLQRDGAKLGYVLAFNDLYFDFSVPTLRAAGVPVGGPPVLISAGDGSVTAYQRIRKGEYQIATVPEPLNLHGWQLMDELNRAFAGQQPSGYVTKAHVVTRDNIDVDGGKENRFDPGNGYREQYKKVWASQ